MALTFVTAPTPLWTPNTTIGAPNIDGFMRAFQNTDRSIVKNIYQDASGSVPYSQPISFQAGGQRGPFYFEVNDPPQTTDPYFLEIFDADDQLIQSFENFQPSGGGGGAPVTVNQDFNNLTPNGQFRFVQATTVSPTPTDGIVAHGGWVFVKNNTSATDSIDFNTVALGTSNPTNTPVREFEYTCTGAGSGETEKLLEVRLKDVRTLEGESFHIGFEALFGTGLDEIEVTAFQSFGTGGSPSASVETAIGTAMLTGVYQQFNFTGTIPSLGGKVKGSDGNDYLSFRFKFPRNQTGNWKIVNVQTTLGSNILPYQYQSTNEAVGDLLPSLDPGLASVSLNVNNVGDLEWSAVIPIGGTLIWWRDVVPTGFLECDGSSLLVADFPALFAVLDYYYGGSGLNFNLPNPRGLFLRATDNGAGRDPDEGSRSPPTVSGTPQGTGSTQTDEVGSHFHDIKFSEHEQLVTGPTKHLTTSATTNLAPTESAGGAETRPKNIYVKLIIKV